MAGLPNDFILKMLRGGAPSALDFVAPFTDQKIGTPGFNPNAPDPRMSRGDVQQPGKPAGMTSKLDGFLGSPGGGMLMNLLAQSGYSTTPGSPFGAIGKAALMNQQQQQGMKMSRAQEELLKAQTGYYSRKAETAGDETAPKVQSAKTLFNGNIGLVMSDSEVIDSGIKEAGRGQVLNVPGVGLIRYNPIDQSITQVATEDIIREGGAARQGAEQAASTAATKSTEQQFDIPRQVNAIDTQIRSIDQTLEEAERALGLVSNTSTGIIGNLLQNIPGTDAFTLDKAMQPIKAALSFDKLSEMRAASPTGGALGQVSERELSLLQDSLVALDQAQNPGDVKRALMKVLTHYDNWKAIIAQQKENLRGQQQDSTSGFKIVDQNASN